MATPINLFNRSLGPPAAPARRQGYNSRYPTLSVTEIMGQRENRPGGYDNTGKPLAPGTQFFSSGWNTSGVGPGTEGYRGSFSMGGIDQRSGRVIPRGYNYGEGTRRPSARNSDEFYAQRDAMGENPLDQLQWGNRNLMQSFLKNAMAEARGQSGTGPAAANGAPDPWADRTTYGPNATGMPTGDFQSPDEQQADVMQLIKEARAQEALDAEERAMLEMEAMKPRTGTGTTTPGATVDGLPSDLWFQYKAQESGDTNRFATPFAAPTDDAGNPRAWQYSHRLAPFLKRLGVGQPFPSRRPL